MRRARAHPVRVAVAAGVLAGALAVSGCSVELGDLHEVPRYQQVQSDGLSLQVLDGMEAAEAPRGFTAFWQTAVGTPRTSVGVASGVQAADFMDAQLAELGRVVPDLETTTGTATDGGDVLFTGTGVDGDPYHGIVAVREGAGVVASTGPDITDDVLRQMVDSVETVS